MAGGIGIGIGGRRHRPWCMSLIDVWFLFGVREEEHSQRFQKED